MSTQPNVLEARELVFGYGSGPAVLDEVDLSVSTGRFVCLLGPNGSGKTTLLKCLLGMLRVRSGQVYLDGRPVRRHSSRERARKMAYVPQQTTVAFDMTALEVILVGRYAHGGGLGLSGPADLSIARQAMHMTGTGEFADRALAELSGGEAQRVMIARALAQQPDVMLLDEPTSHLDIRNQLLIYEMLQRVAHDWPMAVVCVSHDVNLAARFADHLVLMRGGTVRADGPVGEVLRAEVLAETYDVEIELISHDDDPPIVRAR